MLKRESITLGAIFVVSTLLAVAMPTICLKIIHAKVDCE